jgi:signal transduction histidine kinase
LQQLRVLVLEDDPNDAQLTLAELARGGFECITTLATNRAEFEAALGHGASAYDIVLADYGLPSYSGLEALKLLRAIDPLLPFILVSGSIGEERAVGVLRAGATDYVLKGATARLAEAVRRAIQERRDREVHSATQQALAESEKRFRALSSRLLEVQETERTRISRELHDQVGQALTAIKIRLQVLERQPAMPPAQALEPIVGLVDDTLQQVRQLSLDLRPPQLDDLGIAAALRALLERILAPVGLAFEVEARPPNLKLPDPIAVACYRITQESLTNVLRHAKASRVDVQLESGAAGTRLVVADDGVGFDREHVNRRVQKRESTGLLGMEERARLANGRLSIDAGPEGGTRVTVVFP